MARPRVHLTIAEAAIRGLQCRSHLKAAGLMPRPGAEPAGSVWQGQGAYEVYRLDDCMPWKWEPGPTQLRRQAVAASAFGLINSNALVLDTESTGIGRDDELCEISIIDVTGQTVLNTLIRPSVPIPPEATAIHRITDSMVATAPRWAEVADQYAAVIAGRSIVAYNMAFDDRVIAQTHRRYGLTTPQLAATVCLMKLYAVWNGEWDKGRSSWTWKKLVEAAEECGGLAEDSHRALADARMALGVLLYLQRHANGRRPRPRN